MPAYQPAGSERPPGGGLLFQPFRRRRFSVCRGGTRCAGRSGGRDRSCPDGALPGARRRHQPGAVARTLRAGAARRSSGADLLHVCGQRRRHRGIARRVRPASAQSHGRQPAPLLPQCRRPPGSRARRTGSRQACVGPRLQDRDGPLHRQDGCVSHPSGHDQTR